MKAKYDRYARTTKYCDDFNKIFVLGRTIKEIKNTGSDLYFVFEDTPTRFVHMTHVQDCCESVDLEEVIGDLEDLVGSPLLRAEERTSDTPSKYTSENKWDAEEQWTFYEFATIKGSVTLRWYGESNGYYSVSVNLIEAELDLS
jgi:hypothetical protein